MKMIKLLVISLAALSAEFSTADDFKVFTATVLPGIAAEGLASNAQIYYLDEPDLLISKLGHFQPKGSEAVQEAAQRHLASPEGQNLLISLKHAFEGVLGAWSHKIERLPAILINDQYVIYGVYDLAEAERIYLEFIAASKGG